jgi:hypothetical protein
MKDVLNYETILGFKSLEMTDINKTSEKLDVKSLFNENTLDQNEPDLNDNIEIEYKTKGKSRIGKLVLPKNYANYSGSSLKLPTSTSKVTLKTKIDQGKYNNTWLILQNRNVYIPKLEVNGKKLLPIDVNGAYLRYSFDTVLSGLENNEIKITTTFNTGSNNNTVVGIWFD